MKPRIDLLESLEDALRQLPEDCPGFDMEVWAEKKIPESPKLDCGTSACAMGLATTLPDWREAGISITCPPDNPGAFVLAFHGKPARFDTFNELAHFLGMTKDDCEYLFDPTEYEGDYGIERYGFLIIPPSEVANRVRMLIEELKARAKEN